MKPIYGMIVVDACQWSATNGKLVAFKSREGKCKKTSKRFTLTSCTERRQFDLQGKCVANDGVSFRHVARPETFVPCPPRHDFDTGKTGIPMCPVNPDEDAEGACDGCGHKNQYPCSTR